MKLCYILLLLPSLVLLVDALFERPYENPNYFEGDIILTPEERLNIYKPQNTFGASKKKWPGKTIVYQFADDIEKELGAKQAIYAAINEFHRHTCLKFVRRTNQKAYINFHNGQGCGAPLGYRSGVHKVSLQGPGCWKEGTIIHEILHTLGFYHEQSRPDRDQYVEIMWKNINPADMKSNFQKQPWSNVDSLGSPYDYESIMHYHKDGFAKRGTITIRTLDQKFQDKIGQRDGFSKQDIIQINKLYQCGKTFATNPPLTTAYPLCKDINDNCAFYSRYCKDKSWNDFMKRECKFTCSFCNSVLPVQPTTIPGHTTSMPGHTTSRNPGSVQPTTNLNLTTSSNNCIDKLGSKTCTSYDRRGYCGSPSPTLIRYMKDNCAKTCKHC